MIDRFVKAYEANKSKLREMFATAHPSSYIDVVRNVITVISDEEARTWGNEQPDPQRIHSIDDGDYQGTLVYVIGAMGYQPSDYWYVKVYYGSCSGCDTLQSIMYDGRYGEDGDTPSEDQINQYMTLALHIVQGLKEMP